VVKNLVRVAKKVRAKVTSSRSRSKNNHVDLQKELNELHISQAGLLDTMKGLENPSVPEAKTKGAALYTRAAIITNEGHIRKIKRQLKK